VFLQVTKNDNENSKEKAISEINYLDSEITEMFNAMYNVNLENIKISTTKVSETKQYEANESTTLNKEDEEEEPDWDLINDKIESLYSFVPTMTLDFYSLNASQDDVLEFNNNLDELAIAVNGSDKKEALVKLSSLYGVVTNYAKELADNNFLSSLLETKANVFCAYALLDFDKWDDVKAFCVNAISSYSGVQNSISSSDREYAINRGYVILNELSNAVELKSKDVFLLKYKNLLKEFEILAL
jgi:hypothetical protein